VGKVNIHENFELANQYNIATIPRVYIFKGGDKPIQQITGLPSEAVLVKALSNVLESAPK